MTSTSPPQFTPSPLLSVFIIDSDERGVALPIWAFPQIDGDTEIIAKGMIEGAGNTKFKYTRCNGKWIYLFTQNKDFNEKDPLQRDKLSSVNMGILTTLFHPEKYQNLITLLMSKYINSASSPLSPLPVLSAFLSLSTRGVISSEFSDSQWDPRVALICPLKNLVNSLGAELTISLWTAMILKKKILIYSANSSDAMNFVRSAVTFIWHRINPMNNVTGTEILRPLCGFTSTEMSDLQSSGLFVCGTSDREIFTKNSSVSELFDIFIDVPSKSAVIAEAQKGHFAMTKFHKTSGEIFVENAKDAEITDQQMMKIVINQTKSLLESVEQMKGEDGKVTQETLQNAKLPQAMETFVFNVALAEGWTQ